MLYTLIEIDRLWTFDIIKIDQCLIFFNIGYSGIKCMSPQDPYVLFRIEKKLQHTFDIESWVYPGSLTEGLNNKWRI